MRSDPTILDYLNHWTATHPDQRFASFLDRHGELIETYTYQSFEDRTRFLAEYLREETAVERGDRVGLMYSPGLEMVAAFLACARIGVIPVPVSPVTPMAKAAAQRLASIVQDSGAVLILTDSSFGSSAGRARDAGDPDADPLASTGVVWLATDRLQGVARAAQSDSPVETLFLQYTSGSTGAPKGVVVSHCNVIHNCHATINDHQPIAVSWLPQFHDMGLVGYYLYLIVTGGTTYGFSPLDFLRRPVLWFETLSRYRASITSSPNFGFEYCLSPDRMPDDLLQGCDLSAVRVFMSGSETVRPSTYRRFLERFAPYGLRPAAHVAAYGLAENTLAVTGSGRRSVRINRRSLKTGAVEMAADDTPLSHQLELVSAGRPLEGIEVRIVDPDTRVPLADGGIGEIWVAGESTCQGYWNKPELTDHAFGNSVTGEWDHPSVYLRTGDLGFREGRDLFVCGRLKDIIILRGQNYYPEDLEACVEAASDKVQPGNVIAFRGVDGDERLVLAIGLRNPNDRPHPAEITDALRAHGYPGPHTILFVRRQVLEKTTSGKLARRLNRDKWLDHAMPALETHVRDGAAVPLPIAPGLNVESQYASFLAAYALSGDENASPSEVGLDSLATVELLVILERWLDQRAAHELRDAPDVPLLQRLTMSEISALVRRVRNGVGDWAVDLRTHLDALKRERAGRETADMLRDAQLKLPALSLPPRARAHFDRVLMTGGTGFLGPFMLRSLLAQTAATYTVLVRAADPSVGRERLRKGLEAAGLYDLQMRDDLNTRVRVLCGDASSPRLGLSDRVWSRLADTVDTIVHNAAWVDYLRDYHALRAANVEGTRTIVELASTSRRKTLHLVSSTTIFGWSVKKILLEHDSNPEMTQLDFGYAQTKWVSEQLVRAAGERGLEARIYRPAFLTASTAGYGHSTDIVVRLLSFMINHGLAPEARIQLSLMPVDIAAHNMVAVMTSAPHAPVHHVTVDEYFSIVEVTRQISEDYGIAFRYVDLEEFSREMHARCNAAEPAFPLLDFVSRSCAKVALMEHKRYDNFEFRRALEASRVGVPDASLRETVSYLMAYMSAQRMLKARLRGRVNGDAVGVRSEGTANP